VSERKSEEKEKSERGVKIRDNEVEPEKEEKQTDEEEKKKSAPTSKK